jgi:hypothetical protein
VVGAVVVMVARMGMSAMVVGLGHRGRRNDGGDDGGGEQNEQELAHRTVSAK